MGGLFFSLLSILNKPPLAEKKKNYGSLLSRSISKLYFVLLPKSSGINAILSSSKDAVYTLW